MFLTAFKHTVSVRINLGMGYASSNPNFKSKFHRNISSDITDERCNIMKTILSTLDASKREATTLVDPRQ